MTQDAARGRKRWPAWAWTALALGLCVLAGGWALQALRHHARFARGLHAFLSAFGGVIGVVLLLALGLAILFFLDAFLFRERAGGGDTDPDPG